MKLFKIGIMSVALGFTFCLPVHGEDFLIRNATVHSATPKGALQNSDVLIRDGIITRVAQKISGEKNVTEIDGTKKHITPGLINAATQIGIVEIGAVSSTNDDATKHAGFGASFNISAAINFRSTLIPQNRINGLTRAIVIPAAGNSIFSGQGSSIALHSSSKGMLNRNALQVATIGDAAAEFSGGSRASALAMLDTALNESRYLRQNENRYLPGFKWEFSQSIADLKALYPVLDRKVPLVIGAQRVSDIQQLISLSARQNIQVVISGGGEAWVVAAELAKAKIPVLMDPIENLPQFDSLAVRMDGAARLYQAGVKLIFTGGGSHNGYLVRQSAGNAVAYGLPAEAALEAMTINTAEVFNISNYGQIKPGMQADVVMWDGDPLEITSNAELVIIQGEKQKMISRATRLRDRYWELKGDHQQAFQH